jgi:hypothetical protein
MSIKRGKGESKKGKSRKDAARRRLEDANKLQEFVRDGSPSSWLEYGEELRDAAEILWRAEEEGVRVDVRLDFEHIVKQSEVVSAISRPYLLLAGFSLENILKGLVVVREPRHITGGVLSNELKTHDVRALCGKIPGLILSIDEEKFCRQVTDAIPYWGRYPIPLEQNRLMPSVGVTALSRQTFLDLFDRLARELYWAIRDGWKSGIGVETIKVRANRYGDRISLGEKLFDP